LVEELEKLTQTPAKNGARFIKKARELDNRLHDLIAASCGNSFLAKEINRLKILFRAFRDVSWDRYEVEADGHRLAEEAHEHLAIMQALAANDRKGASKAMSRHIQSGVKYWSRALPDAVAP
jgi:DNA-binding GntR family transcriptional regulator